MITLPSVASLQPVDALPGIVVAFVGMRTQGLSHHPSMHPPASATLPGSFLPRTRVPAGSLQIIPPLISSTPVPPFLFKLGTDSPGPLSGVGQIKRSKVSQIRVTNSAIKGGSLLRYRNHAAHDRHLRAGIPLFDHLPACEGRLVAAKKNVGRGHVVERLVIPVMVRDP